MKRQVQGRVRVKVTDASLYRKQRENHDLRINFRRSQISNFKGFPVSPPLSVAVPVERFASEGSLCAV